MLPLSEVKMTTVSSAKPSLSTASSNRPTAKSARAVKALTVSMYSSSFSTVFFPWLLRPFLIGSGNASKASLVMFPGLTAGAAGGGTSNSGSR